MIGGGIGRSYKSRLRVTIEKRWRRFTNAVVYRTVSLICFAQHVVMSYSYVKLLGFVHKLLRFFYLCIYRTENWFLFHGTVIFRLIVKITQHHSIGFSPYNRNRTVIRYIFNFRARSIKRQSKPIIFRTKALYEQFIQHIQNVELRIERAWSGEIVFICDNQLL